MLALAVPPTIAAGQTALRDLPAQYVAGTAHSISITLDAPGGTTVLAIEETPPSAWTVSNVSDGGSWDTQAEKVKWGPFFSPTLPMTITYDVTPPGGASGSACFSGTASFSGLDEPVEGDACIVVGIPAVSEWAVVVMAGLLLTAGTAIARSRHRLSPGSEPIRSSRK